jgi:preprotein translocase subunit SecA
LHLFKSWQLRAKEAVIHLAEHFDLDRFSDWVSEEIPEVFAMIGKDAIKPLRDYLFDSTNPEMARVHVAHSLECIGQKNPELKDDCIKVLSDYLEQATEDYPDLNGFTVSYLADLKAANAIDVIRQAFEKGIVSFGVTGDLEDVEVLMGFREKRTTPKPRYNELFNHNGIKYTVQEPVVKDKKIGRNDPCPCGSGKKYKKCCLK